MKKRIQLSRIVGHECQSLGELIILLLLMGAADKGEKGPKPPSELMKRAYLSVNILDKAIRWSKVRHS